MDSYSYNRGKSWYLLSEPDTECSVIYRRICNKSDDLLQISKLRTEASSMISAIYLENYSKYHGSTSKSLLRLRCSKHISYQATIFATYNWICIIFHVAFSMHDVEKDFMKQREYMVVKWFTLKAPTVTTYNRYSISSMLFYYAESLLR